MILMGNRRNLHIYQSDFKFESRMIKETSSLLALNIVDEIIIAAIHSNGQQEEEQISQNTKVRRFRILSKKYFKIKILRLFSKLEFLIRLFFYYRKDNFDYINCHSILVLPVGVLLKKMGVTDFLIYDTHELETETVGLSGLNKSVFKFLEKKLIKHCDKVICVCQPIADWYKKEYKLSTVHVIQNMPYNNNLAFTKSQILKTKLNIPLEDILFIYQGGLMPGRGIETLLNVFSRSNSNRHIVFMGYGELVDQILTFCNKYSNIHFHEAVPMHEILNYTSSADIGIFYLPGKLCLSYELSLPNKFGEYILAGIPIVISDNLTYLKSIIDQNNLGWNVEDEDGLQTLINDLSLSEYSDKRNYVTDYQRNIGWEYEEKEYMEIYKK
jgi:glycosyltransferase involved in cell wall biosynthesis